MKKFQQIFSIFLIVVLIGTYIATFIAAICASPKAHNLFLACDVMTIVIPVFLYIMLLFAKLARDSNMKKINEQLESLSEAKNDTNKNKGDGKNSDTENDYKNNNKDNRE